MFQHFRGTMNYWDLAIVNRLAEQRPFLMLDNSGVGKSEGEVPTTYAGWADNVIAVLGALHVEKIDLLGFSMAGCVAQMVALNTPHLIHKLILKPARQSLFSSVVPLVCCSQRICRILHPHRLVWLMLRSRARIRNERRMRVGCHLYEWCWLPFSANTMIGVLEELRTVFSGL